MLLNISTRRLSHPCSDVKSNETTSAGNPTSVSLRQSAITLSPVTRLSGSSTLRTSDAYRALESMVSVLCGKVKSSNFQPAKSHAGNTLPPRTVNFTPLTSA